MSQIILNKRSSSTAITAGVTTLAFGQLAETNISGVTRLYIGDSSDLAREIAGAAYALLASPAFTGTPTVPTASTGTDTTQAASTAFVNASISAALVGGVEYKGSIDCSANPDYPAAAVGDLYIVSVAGKIGGASGENVEAGDFIICNTANAGGSQASVGVDFDIIQGNIDANVLAGAGLVVNGAALDVNVDNSSIEINADALRVKAAGITNDMLAGSIADSKLSTIATANKVSGSAVQLASGSAIENNTGLDVSVDTTSIVNNAGTLEVGTVDGGTF